MLAGEQIRLPVRIGIPIVVALTAIAFVHIRTGHGLQQKQQIPMGQLPTSSMAGLAAGDSNYSIFDMNVYKDVFTFPVLSGTVSPADRWSFATGDFDGDGWLDLVAHHPSNDVIFVLKNEVTSSGKGSFVPAVWGNAPGGAGADLKLLSGHFVQSNNRTDIAYYNPNNGTIYVGSNTGSSFAFTKYATIAPAAGWQVAAADLTTDRLTDVVGYFPDPDRDQQNPKYGTVWVFENNGAGAFTIGSPWAQTGPTYGWDSLFVGDFNRDGKVDIGLFLLDPYPHQPPEALGPHWAVIDVGANNYPSRTFTFSEWTRFSNVTGENHNYSLIAGSFAGDGTNDVIAYDRASGDGSLNLGRNAVNGFSFSQAPWASTITPKDGMWTFLPGDFNNDGRMDVVGYYPNGTLWLGVNTGLPPEGYAWPLSAKAGETIDLYLSGETDGQIDIIHHRSGETPEEPDIRATFQADLVKHKIANADPWKDGCGWPSTVGLRISEFWPSGIYSARLKSRNGGYFYVPFVVKPQTPSASNVAVLANTNTWLAYNYWGGNGKYSGAAYVSHLRPNPSASPSGESFQNRHLARAETWVLTWLEDNGVTPHVYTDTDFHNYGIPSSYRTLVITTHPEYWTRQMYENVKTFIRNGGSLVYLGGNGIFENGEYSNAEQSQMKFYGGKECNKELNVGTCITDYRCRNLFRSTDSTSPIRENEIVVLGISSRDTGMENAKGYTIIDPNNLALQNTGLNLQYGAMVGNAGLNYRLPGSPRAAAGWETDSTDGKNDCACAPQCDKNTVPASVIGQATGGPFAQAKDTVALPDGGTQEVNASEMAYYKYAGGNFVFAAGSITFGGALVVGGNRSNSNELQVILRNVMGIPRP